MLNRLKKTPTTCTSEDARFLLLLCLGREPHVAAELETYAEQSFFGALKRVLKSTAFSHSLFDPFVLDRKPMQIAFSAEQSAVVRQGLLRHFKLTLPVDTSCQWLEILAAALATSRMQKAFLSEQDADRLQYLQSKLEACSREPAGHIVGAVHQTAGKTVRGFAATADRQTPLVLDFFLNGNLAGSATADQTNREISEKYHVSENTAFSHTLETSSPERLSDACLLIFERENGAMICPPKNLVLSVKAAAQTTARVRGDLDKLLSAHAASDNDQIIKLLTALNERLPSLDNYASMRLADYPLYKDIYCTRRPPDFDTLNLTILIVLDDDGETCAGARTERSLEAQSYRQFSVVRGNLPEDVSGFDLLIRLNPGDLLDEHALGWFASAATNNPNAIILRTGHDHYSETGAAGLDYSDPVFICDFDPLILQQKRGYACAYAIKLHQWKSASLSEPSDSLWLKVFDRHGSDAFATIDEILLSVPLTTPDASSHPLALPDPDTSKKLAIIIPTKDKLDILKPCVESLLRTIREKDTTEIIIVDNASTDTATTEWLSQIQQEKKPKVRVQSYDAPFNWADINNQAVAKSDAGYFLFLNNDTLAIESGWDVTLRQLLEMKDAGVVGAKLLFADDTIQHAGVVLNSNSLAVHEGAGEPTTSTGYAGRLSLTRQCEAVTGAFLACSKATFEAVGGFDAENFPITFNDIDFCFKVSEAGHQVIYSPMITFYHLESVSRGYDGATAEKANRAKAEHDRLRTKWAARIVNDRWYPARLKAAGNQGDIMINAPGTGRAR